LSAAAGGTGATVLMAIGCWAALCARVSCDALLRETMKNAATRPAAAIDPPMIIPIV
jgi:hypothetical protein